MSLVELGDPASSQALLDIHRKLDASRYDEDFFWRHAQSAKLSRHKQRASLWNNQHVAVGRVQGDSLISHALPDRVMADAQALLQVWGPGTTQSLDRLVEHALSKVEGRPAELLRADV